jgi:phenylpyruvate tautomerase PptA (4-oxalocrotonate tautomerase family)
MPLSRIDLARGKSVAYRRTVGEVVYDAMVNVINVPKDDRFQVITEHDPEMFVFDPTYLGIKRSADCIFIQVTLNAGRDTDMKKAFYKAIAEELHSRLNVRPEDVFINLVEVPKENWSFGNGLAQYAS